MRARIEPRHLLHVFSTFEVGGPQVRFCEIANALGDGYRHTIIAMDQNLECSNRLANQAVWQPLPVTVAKGRGLSLGNLVRFRRLLARLRPAMLLTYGWGALEWALVNRWRPLAPHLHFEDGFGPEESPAIQLRRRVYMRRIALGKNMRVVVPSRTLWQVATECWGLTAEVLLIPNGIDCERFAPSTNRTPLYQLGVNPNGLVIGTIAALRPEKNLARLITAFAQLASDLSVNLILAGDGPERSKLEQLAETLGVKEQIHFAGPVEHPEDLYSCFDIFAMSSDTEQMPISLLEAMASGLPIVATDVGDIAAVVAPENRFLIEGCRDAQTIAEGLRTLATNAAMRAELGKLNRARACSKFALSKMMEIHKALLDAS